MSERYMEECGIENEALCGCCHAESGIDKHSGKHSEHNHEHSGNKLETVIILISPLLLALSFLPFLNNIASEIIVALSAIIAGYPVMMNGIKALSNKNIDENLLMTISVIAAFLISEFREGAAIAIFFRVGEMLEEYAENRSRKSIKSISEIRPDDANIETENGNIIQIPAESVKIGTIIIVLPHERVPIDGVIVEGVSLLDSSALTGESMPVEGAAGVYIKSGMVNGSSTLKVKTTELFGMSAASRIIDTVENAVQMKGDSQRIITRLAKYYTPIAVITGALIALIPSLITGDYKTWVYRGLFFIVSSCPCAIVLSVPLGFFSSMGAAAKIGVLVKGGKFVEAMNEAKTILFDKTGTLTTGVLTVSKAVPQNGYSEETVLEFAAACEYYSEHPIARSISTAAKEIDSSLISDFEELAGGGTKAVYKESEIICGGKRLMNAHGISIPEEADYPVYVAVNSKIIGSVELRSEIREDAAKAIEEIKKSGIDRIAILTGDNEKSAKELAEMCGISEVYSGLLPEEKLSKLIEIREKEGKVIYVGDGINDAPVLAAADAGIAMGMGAEAATEAGDLVLTGTRLSRIADAKCLFSKTVRIVKINIAFALLAKIGVIILGMIGIAPMWAAIFADVGVLVLTVLNSSRLLLVKKYSR